MTHVKGLSSCQAHTEYVLDGSILEEHSSHRPQRSLSSAVDVIKFRH